MGGPSSCQVTAEKMSRQRGGRGKGGASRRWPKGTVILQDKNSVDVTERESVMM